MSQAVRRSCVAAAVGAAALLATPSLSAAATHASPSARTTGGAAARPSAHRSTAARSLRYRTRGRDVAQVQRWLRTLGYYVHVTGYYGPETRRAVQAFERYHHLRVDGWLSRYDLSVLRAAANRMSSGGSGTTAQGTNGTSHASPRTAQDPFPATATRAGLNADGTATPPTDAPTAVQQIIEAGNQIASKPYRYGGGHGHWQDSGYDCSGSVSYALHGAGLLRQALTSGGFESWGSRGPGQWVTIYANGGHVYMIVAGLRFDTSGATEAGTRWQVARRSSSGYVVRHPTGL